MTLTSAQLFFKLLKTVFYFSLLWTISLQGYFLLKIFIRDNSDGEYSAAVKFLIQSLKILFGVTLYSFLLIVVAGLIVSEFAEETDEELRNSGRYAVHQRKLDSGYLKETGMQTDSETMIQFTPPQNAVDDGTNSENGKAIIDLNEEKKDVEQTNVYKTIVFKSGIVRAAITAPTSDISLNPEIYKVQGLKNHKSISSPGIKFSSSFYSNSIGQLQFSCEKFAVDSESSSITFEELGGIDKLQHILYENVITPFVLSASTVDVPRAILLIGRRGSGKSCIIQGIVNQIRSMVVGTEVKFYKVECSNCVGSFIDSGATFHDIFHGIIESSPFAVLQVGNIDHLCSKSVPKLLSELGSTPPGKVLVVATANDREGLPEQIVQITEPGKFDYIFEIDSPDLLGRLEILKIHFNKRECPVDETDLLELADLTSSFNAGELEYLADAINRKARERYSRSCSSISKNKKWHNWHHDERNHKMSSLQDTRASLIFRHKRKEVTRNHLISAFERCSRKRLDGERLVEFMNEQTVDQVNIGTSPSYSFNLESES